MKIRLILISLLLSYALISLSQVHREKYTYKSQLGGTATFMTIFVDTSEDIWENEEKDFFFKEFERGQKWIADQALGYGKEIQFDNNSFFFDNREVIYVDAINRGENSPSEIVRKIVHKRGYRSFEEFLERNRYDESIEKLKIVLFVKSKGRSHAYQRRSINNVDIAVIYCQSTYGLRTDRFVMAHEILHQFGAWDLYFGESQTKKTAAKAMELYPNSIMINTHKNKSDLEVDRLTAWRVGWYGHEEEFDQFNPDTLREEKALENRTSKKGGFSIKIELDPEKRKKKKEGQNQNE